MPPAYLRAPSVLEADAKRPLLCQPKPPQTKRQAETLARRRGGVAARCLDCGQWHHTPREPR